jgi:hypothetical protein
VEQACVYGTCFDCDMTVYTVCVSSTDPLNPQCVDLNTDPTTAAPASMAVPVVSVGEGRVVLLALLGAKMLVSRTSRRISTTMALVVTHVRSLIIFCSEGVCQQCDFEGGYGLCPTGAVSRPLALSCAFLGAYSN